MRIALIGTRGVPAQYGGFETCVEEVGTRLANAGHDVIVYCRTAGRNDPRRGLTSFGGMELVHLPAVHRRSIETLSHSAVSIAHLVLRRRADVALVFNAANAPLLPALRLAGLPVATHVDGLEWQRGKWGAVGQRYYRLAESAAVRWSDALIADAEGISDYLEAEFGAHSELLAYGAPLIHSSNPEYLRSLDLLPKQYHLIVARLEPENHVDVIVEGYVRSAAKLPLVVVGSAPYAEKYSAQVRSLADQRVRFLGGVWDQDLLNELYANALTYFHGHSVGGTNPSLLRAIGAGAATDAFDISFNREVLGPAGRYWSSPADVSTLVTSTEADPEAAALRGAQCRGRARAYDWDDVANGYERLCVRLSNGELTRSGLSGRRAGPGWERTPKLAT
jgi:glycosyltransferase involved in cell wall biosynthesis